MELRGHAAAWIAAITVTACGGIVIQESEGDGGASTDAADGGRAQSVPDSFNDWSCVGHVVLAPSAKSTLAWQVQANDPVGGHPRNDVAVAACGSQDGPCDSPLATADTGDAGTGLVTLSLPAGTMGFDGYWQAQPPNDVSTLSFVNVPIRNDVQVNARQVWTLSEMKIALNSAGIVWNQSKGIVGFQIQDCNSRYLHQDEPFEPLPSLALGVAVSIDPPDPEIATAYIVADTLSTTQDRTDETGQGGFANVPEGWVKLTAKIAATGQIIGTARVYSRAGAITGTVLVPSP